MNENFILILRKLHYIFVDLMTDR